MRREVPLDRVLNTALARLGASCARDRNELVIDDLPTLLDLL